MRIEKDPLGKKEVPDEAYFGIHTQRALENFQISRIKIPPYFYKSIAQLKLACCKVNRKDLGEKKFKAIKQATEEVISGKFDDQFCLDYLQAGMGTPMNMNVNEVIANRANELINCAKGNYLCIHPNDDINRGQSTNNIIPSALKLSSLLRLKKFQIELKKLILVFSKKGKEFSSIVKTGRTHLQDAVPISLGAEFNAYFNVLNVHFKQIYSDAKILSKLGIGGNAIGTSVNTSKNYDLKIIKQLSGQLKIPFSVVSDHVTTTQFPNEFLKISQSLNAIAVDMTKICNDLRLLNSGPVTGINEIDLPAVEPGSSIMPGKINPSIAECMNMICYQVMGNNQTIILGSQAGQLELNVMMPLIVKNLLESIDIMTNGFKMLRKSCISGITANEQICLNYFENSNGLATLLNPIIGYDKSATIAQEALKTGKTIKEVVLKKGILTQNKWNELVKKSIK